MRNEARRAFKEPGQNAVRDISLFKTKLPFDQLDQRVPDFGMAGDRGFTPSPGIRIDIMARTMAVEIAATLNERTHEFVAFHRSTPTSRVCAPACSGAGSDSSIRR